MEGNPENWRSQGLSLLGFLVQEIKRGGSGESRDHSSSSPCDRGLQVIPPYGAPWASFSDHWRLVVLVGRAQDGRASFLSWELPHAFKCQAARFQVDVGRQTESKFQLVVQQTRQNPLSASPNPTCQHPPKSAHASSHCVAHTGPAALFPSLLLDTSPDRPRPLPALKTCSPNRRLARRTPPPPRRSIRPPPAPPTTHPLRPPPCRQNSGAGSSSTTSPMAETAGGLA